MPAPRVTAKTNIFELEIVLEEVEPLVRRRVQIPGEVNLAVLREVVQSAMGLVWPPKRARPGRRRGRSAPSHTACNVTTGTTGRRACAGRVWTAALAAITTSISAAVQDR